MNEIALVFAKPHVNESSERLNIKHVESSVYYIKQDCETATKFTRYRRKKKKKKGTNCLISHLTQLQNMKTVCDQCLYQFITCFLSVFNLFDIS